MKKKLIFPKYTKITLVATAVLICIYFIIKLLEKANIYIYLFKCGAEEILPIIEILCIALIISAASVLLYKNIKCKGLIVILTAAVSLVAFWYSLVLLVFTMNGTYFEFTSNDKKHNIIVNECSFLLAGWGDIYEKTSFCTMERVGGYTTDDGYLPFSFDEYYFVWNENNFELHYADGMGGYGVSHMEYAVN